MLLGKNDGPVEILNRANAALPENERRRPLDESDRSKLAFDTTQWD